MKPINVTVTGHTPWRDRAEPYSYDAFTDDYTRSFIVFALTNPPGHWQFSDDAKLLYKKIYGASGEAAMAKGAVCENVSPVWVYGTLVTSPGQNELEEALKLKAAGKLFGYDLIPSSPVDHTGKVLIDTPFGKVWVDASSLTLNSFKANIIFDNFRLIVREEVEKFFLSNSF